MQQLLTRIISIILRNVHMQQLLTRIISFLFRESVKQYDYNDFSAVSFKFALQRALRFVVDNKIEGSYYEFGLFEGNSFLVALEESKKLSVQGYTLHCNGFDSFEGHPEPLGPLDESLSPGGVNKWRKGQYYCDYSKFVRRLDENNIAPDSYSLYEGFYNDTLTSDLQKQMDKAAIVHSACDLYSSTREVLEFIKPLLQQGTIVMFNSFYYGLGNPHVGESGALQEFLENNKDIQFIDYYNYSHMCKAFIVNKALA